MNCVGSGTLRTLRVLAFASIRSYNRCVSAGASPRPSGNSAFGRTSDTPQTLSEIAGSGGKRFKYKHEVIYKEVIRYGKTKR